MLCIIKRQVLPSHKVYRAVLVFVSLALSQKSAYTASLETTDTGLVHRAVFLFKPQLSRILVAPAHGDRGMARLS